MASCSASDKPIKKHVIDGINLNVYNRQPHRKRLNQEQPAVQVKGSPLSNTWMGTPGAGVFATRNIAAGEVVFSEDPQEASTIAFERTPQFDVIQDLKPNLILDAFEATMPGSWDIVVGRNYTWPSSQAVSCLDWDFDAMPLPAKAITAEMELRCSRLVGIFLSNAIVVQSTEIFSGPTGGPDGEGIVFTLRTAYINHCSVPNVTFNWAGKGSPLIVRATKKIQRGEELLRAYVDECQTSEARGMFLKDLHDIICHCKGCEGDFAQEADQRRQNLVMIKQDMMQNARNKYTGKGEVLTPEAAARMYEIAKTTLDMEPMDCLLDMKLEVHGSLASIYRTNDIAKSVNHYLYLLELLKLREGHCTQRFEMNAWLLTEALREEREQAKHEGYTVKEWQKKRVVASLDPVSVNEFKAQTLFLVMLDVLLAKLRRHQHDAEVE